MRKVFYVVTIASILAVIGLVTVSGPSVVKADQPANPNCWGVVTSQRAVALHDIGEHASSQATPRLGLGNFARLLFDLGISAGPHISDAGTAAAAIDQIPETSCP